MLPMRILVTGGAGFIGSAVVRQLIGGTEHVVLNLDKLTYAGFDGFAEIGRRASPLQLPGPRHLRPTGRRKGVCGTSAPMRSFT